MVTEEELQAYADDVLQPAERAAVEAHLASHAEDAARMRAYREQNEALHRLFDPVLDEPHAPRLDAPRRANRAGRWRWGAALAATFVLGAALGAGLHAMLDRGRSAPAVVAIARQAALAHAAYKPEVRHPVEVVAAEEQHLVAWLSKRLDTKVRAPSLVTLGYRLLGGRLLPPAGEVGSAPVAWLLYEDARGKRLSLLVRREPSGGDTAFRFTQDGATSVFYWIDGALGYALAGELNKDDLSVLARAVYQQLNP